MKILIAEDDLTSRRLLKIAGAVRHELNQPMPVVLSYTELLMMDAPLYASVQAIESQIDRMGTITKKLISITQYKTKDYLKGKFLDLEKPSEE
jgi:signal transduction histidine kinase